MFLQSDFVKILWKIILDLSYLWDKDNPTLRDFGYNDNTIWTQKMFRPITGNCHDDEQLNEIDVDAIRTTLHKNII